MDNKPLKITIPKRVQKELEAAEVVKNQDHFNALALGSLTVGGSWDVIKRELIQDGATDEEVQLALIYAFDYMLNMADAPKIFELGKSKTRLEMLFLRANSVQNIMAALAVVKEINKLNRLYVPTKSERIEAQIEWLNREALKTALKKGAENA